MERALLLQELEGAPAPVRREGPARPTRCSSAWARTPASSTSARATRSPSRSSRTTTRATSSRTRAPPPASAASCATSSRWAPARSPSWTRCASARPTPRTPAASCPASSPASVATATASACPNIGGEVVFDPTYLGNPLVNALCVGVMRHEDIKLAKASGPGNLVVLFGAKTGGDGIGGVSVLASETFDADGPAKRPERAGRRPVHREGAHRVLPRDLRGRPRRRHPGPRRRGHLVRHVRARLRRHRRHARRARPGAAARRLARARGDPHERVAGAHVRDRRAGEARRVPRDLHPLGRRRDRHRRGHRRRPARDLVARRARRRRCRRAPSPTRARSTSGRTPAPPTRTRCSRRRADGRTAAAADHRRRAARHAAADGRLAQPGRQVLGHRAVRPLRAGQHRARPARRLRAWCASTR